MRVSACVGKYAEIPYCIPGVDVNVYSMEELCYCMKENAFLLDLPLMKDELLKWIEHQCGLHGLVNMLYPLVHRKGSLSAFVGTILQYVGLYDEKTIREVEQVLKQGAGLTGMEKKKRQIDYLVKIGKYDLALKKYEQLLTKWQDEACAGMHMPAIECLASIWHNRGVAYTGMMNYGRAAESFLKAYDIKEDESHALAYLAAMRMKLSGEEYVSFVAEQGRFTEYALALEKQMNACEQEWEQQPECLMLYNMGELKTGGQMQKYYIECEKMAEALKNSYRISIADR